MGSMSFENKKILIIYKYVFYLIFILKEKSIVIATYAICGFSNFGSIAIQIAT